MTKDIINIKFDWEVVSPFTAGNFLEATRGLLGEDYHVMASFPGMEVENISGVNEFFFFDGTHSTPEKIVEEIRSQRENTRMSRIVMRAEITYDDDIRYLVKLVKSLNEENAMLKLQLENNSKNN